MACKFGQILADAASDVRAKLEEMLADGAQPAEVARLSPVPVHRATVRQHRDRLCRCYTHVEAAEPGATDAATKPAPRVEIPKGWQPQAEYGADGGHIVTSPRPAGEEPEPEALFAEFPDIDPDRWDVKDVRRSRWQAADGTWLEAFRVAFIPRQRTAGVPVDDLLAVVERYAGTEPERPAPGGGAFVVPSGDLQLGKIDGGGTAGIIERFCEKTLQAAARLEELRARGQALGTIVLPWLGDCIEGSVSQNGRTMARQDLGPSEQLRLFRRLLLFQIETFAPRAAELLVPVVPGNHDETTRVQDTHGTDSWAIEGAAAVADALKLAPTMFGHVKFIFPQRGELSVTLDVADTRLGMVHGHQFARGDAVKWLSGQAMSRQPIGDADILLSAHLHHLRMLEFGDGRHWIQIPAMDGGSTWFRHKTGAAAPAGLLSMVVEGGCWRDLERH